MARHCACDRVLMMFGEDVRVGVLDHLARSLWLQLALRMVKGADPGVLRPGLSIGFPLLVSRLVGWPETEVETHLKPILETGALQLREDGALVLPGWESDAKARAARENGRKGGRPRRGETPDQRELRLLSVVSDKPTETQTEPSLSDPRVRVASLLSSAQAEEASKQADARDEVTLGFEVAELAGLDPARGTFTFGPLRQWLSAGADAELILEVVGAVASRRGYVAPRGLGYFTSAMNDAIATRREVSRRQAAAPAPDAQQARFLRARDFLTKEWLDGRSGAPDWSLPPEKIIALAEAWAA